MDVPVVVPITKSEFVVHDKGGQQTVRMLGHRAYVRKRIMPDEFDGGVIVRPDYMKNDNVVCDVLSVGPDVGKWRKNPPRDVDHTRLPNRIQEIAVGTTLVFPEFHPNKSVISRSPWCHHDFFVDLAIAIFEVIEDAHDEQ